MTRVIPVVAAVMLVVGTFGALPVAGAAVAGAADGGADTAEQVQARNGSLAPGERLAAVIGVQETEIEGELELRTFAVRVANANSNASKASVVRDQIGALEQRLQELEAEKRELERAHENGSMSTGEYRAKLARLYAKNRVAMGLVNTTEATADGLPEETLAAKGINVTAIRTLKTEASNLTGPEVAEIARTIAGPNVGRQAVSERAPPVAQNASERGFGRAGNASERGPPEDAGPDNRTDRGGAAGNETGPGDRGQGAPGNETDRGDRGGAAGNGTDDGGTQGPPDDDRGQNNGTDNSGDDRGQSGDDRGQSGDDRGQSGDSNRDGNDDGGNGSQGGGNGSQGGGNGSQGDGNGGQSGAPAAVGFDVLRGTG